MAFYYEDAGNTFSSDRTTEGQDPPSSCATRVATLSSAITNESTAETPKSDEEPSTEQHYDSLSDLSNLANVSPRERSSVVAAEVNELNLQLLQHQFDQMCEADEAFGQFADGLIEEANSIPPSLMLMLLRDQEIKLATDTLLKARGIDDPNSDEAEKIRKEAEETFYELDGTKQLDQEIANVRRTARFDDPVRYVSGPPKGVVDALLHEDAMRELLAGVEAAGKMGELKALVNKATTEGISTHPESELELIAALYVWASHPNDEHKARIRVDDKDRELLQNLADNGQLKLARVGGCTAFWTASGYALGGEPAMIWQGEMPENLKALLLDSPSIKEGGCKVITPNSEIHQLHELETNNQPSNFGLRFLPAMNGTRTKLMEKIDGFKVQLSGDSLLLGPRDTSMNILVTGGGPQTSGEKAFTADRILAEVPNMELLQLGGWNYVTCPNDLNSMFDVLDTLKTKGIPTAVAYSIARKKEIAPDSLVWASKRHSMELLSVNADEHVEILKFLLDGANRTENPIPMTEEQLETAKRLYALAKADDGWSLSRHDKPQLLLQNAKFLREFFGIPIFRTRGFGLDVLCLDPEIDLSPQAHHSIDEDLLLSRSLPLMKIADDTGVLDSREKITKLLNPLTGEYVASFLEAGRTCEELWPSPHSNPVTFKRDKAWRTEDGTTFKLGIGFRFAGVISGTGSVGDLQDISFNIGQARGELFQQAREINLRRREMSF